MNLLNNEITCPLKVIVTQNNDLYSGWIPKKQPVGFGYSLKIAKDQGMRNEMKKCGRDDNIDIRLCIISLTK